MTRCDVSIVQLTSLRGAQPGHDKLLLGTAVFGALIWEQQSKAARQGLMQIIPMAVKVQLSQPQNEGRSKDATRGSWHCY